MSATCASSILYEQGGQEPDDDIEATAGPQAGPLRCWGSRRRTLAAGVCIAAVGWVACTSTALPQIQWRGSQLLGLSSAAEIASLPYVDEDTGQEIALDSERKARCVAEIVGAAFLLADTAMNPILISQDCVQTGNANTAQGLHVAHEMLSNLEMLMQTLNRTANSTQTTKSLQETLMGELVQTRQHVNQAQSADVSIYSTQRAAQSFCARDVSLLFSSSLGMSAQLSQALPNCAPSLSKQVKRKSKCAQQVLLSLSNVNFISALIALMVQRCTPDVTSYRSCSYLVEIMSFLIAGTARLFSNTVFLCANLGPRPRVKVSPEVGLANCAGTVFSAMGYVSAAGLNIASGKYNSCSNAKSFWDSNDDLTNLTPEEDMELTKYRAQCARDELSAVRQLLFAGYRMITTAASCTNTNYLCQMDVSRAASAFAGVGQGLASLTDKCYTVPPEVPQTTEEREAQMASCAERSGAVAKMLSVTISYAIEAASSCIQPLARTRCAASVWRAIAGLSSLAQQFTIMHTGCKKTPSWFVCGRSQRFTAQSFRIFVLGFTGALLNCPLSPFREEWDATGHFNFPAFFTFP